MIVGTNKDKQTSVLPQQLDRKDQIAKGLVQCVALPHSRSVEVCSYKISIFAPIFYPTPEKMADEPKNQPLQKESHLYKSNLSFFRLHVSFWKVIHGKRFCCANKTSQ